MNGKVLYAEDEFTNRKLLEIHLRNQGITCDLAMDGAQAVEMIRNNSYDLIILDQYMPNKNGDEIAREIRVLHPSVPLIAITSDDGEIGRLLDSGFDEVFIKPIRGTTYMETILRYLSNSNREPQHE